MQVSVESARGDATNLPPIDRTGGYKNAMYIHADVGNNRQFSVGPSMQRGMKLLIYRPTDKSKKKKKLRTRAISLIGNRAFEMLIRDAAAIGNVRIDCGGKRSREDVALMDVSYLFF